MTRKCIPCGTPPTPYYKDVDNSLTQDHTAIFRDTQYAAGIEFPAEFVVPAIGEDIQVCVKNLVNLVVGSYIWNPAYGYLQIAHWDSCTGKIGLLNDDINGAAIPGTVVSEGSLWAVVARPCCADQDATSIYPFLAEDYVIPSVSNSVTLQVTSTFGLIEGTLVRIGSNVYFLDQINSSLEIVVTNQGAGGTPGDEVFAKDVNGDLQYLITQAAASACVSPGSDTIKLVGCDGSTESSLEGEFVGQIPVLQNTTTQEVSFELLDTEARTCTELTVALSVLSATPSYTIDVADESIFSIGQIIQIDFGALRWVITDNTTPNELDITCTTGNPGSNFVVPSGSSVCLRLSSDLLNNLNTDKLLGRDSSGVGQVEEIGVTGGLEFTGTGGIQRAALTGNITAPAGSNVTTIANGVIVIPMLDPTIIDGNSRLDIATVGQVQDSTFTWCGTSGGSANAQTLTPTPAITTYVTGEAFDFIAGFTNTAALTINISGVGAISVVKGLGVPLSPGDVTAQHKYRFIISGGSAYLVAADTLPLLYLNPAISTLVSSTTKTTIMSFTVPANTLGAYRGIRLTLLGYYHNESGGAATCTFTAQFGSTTLITNNTSLGAVPSGVPDFPVKLVLELFNTGATNTQKAYLSVDRVFTTLITVTSSEFQRGTATEDSTTNLAVTITAQHSVNNATTFLVTERSYIEFI